MVSPTSVSVVAGYVQGRSWPRRRSPCRRNRDGRSLGSILERCLGYVTYVLGYDEEEESWHR
jgi:hypothetical protein